jgi:hypothetical protein
MKARSSFLLAAVALMASTLACGIDLSAPINSTPLVGAGTPDVVMPTMTAAALVPSTPSPQPQPSINESRRMTLEFPNQIRMGDSEIVTLKLEMDDYGNIVPTAEVAGNAITGNSIEIPDLYDTHKVNAEARIDIAGMDISPAGTVSEPLARGQSIVFRWSVRPREVGVYRGTVSFRLLFVDKSNGEESRITVSDQIVQIETVKFFGLSANLTRSVGTVGSAVGSVLGFPFVKDILKSIYDKRKKRRGKRPK